MPIKEIINNVSENLRTDDHYKNAGQHQLRVDMFLLIESLETLENLENLDFKKATAGQKEVERRRRNLNIQCLEVLLDCEKMNNELFDTWVFDENNDGQSAKQETEQKDQFPPEHPQQDRWLPPNHPILELDHNATSNPYLVDFK